MMFLERVRTIALLCLTIFGCLGNILILIVVHQRFFRKTTSAAFISALSISDCIVLCLQSLHIVTKLHPEVTSYDCIVFYLIDVFRLLSVWIVCVINIERCSLVFNPCHLPRLNSRNKSRILVIILSIISALIFSHYVKHMHIKFTHKSNQTVRIRSYCAYKLNFDRLTWECIKSALTYWFTVPLCIVCNLIIIQRLRRASHIERTLISKNPRISQLSYANKLDLSSKQRQLTAMLLASSICFVLTATPSTIHAIYILLTHNFDHIQYAIHIWTNILLHFHHASNFLAFIFSCARFRIELIQLFRRYIPCLIYIHWYKRSVPKTDENIILSAKQQRTSDKLLKRKKEKKRNTPVNYRNGIVEIGVNNCKNPHRQSAPIVL